jgi:hypothetical protein
MTSHSSEPRASALALAAPLLVLLAAVLQLWLAIAFGWRHIVHGLVPVLIAWGSLIEARRNHTRWP